ncbi:P-loop containing nucleoside triphosphate hydrolase protein [Amniculicola lignicola CBS 123094]|uniref:P-loop containing nucleoside triphosphate hydrolase protein n=1 Tax=Amniculicola lignicola CBS 123094 TaxID=1392246 RepID=A0A6A5W1T6_9PLEO|nr:P-loop containing nucleoside triphosphate hydrolase protein [Amniculicola lignicola CBS 123094]
METSTMETLEPPMEPEIYVFPDKIVAFNLGSQKWVTLEVDQIREVSWNKRSFEYLVIDNESKELVQALVTNQIARQQGNDMIERKGNGLIILLEGAPGAGKTFTAESVAEMAERPLYRVTGGDIGTKPENAEKSLEGILYLSKIWGCVVLLDEAEMFLEQRRTTDFKRNALVSVFFRNLEYYEGIVILTLSRVAAFDEAFKSRIRLSLHYEYLNQGQRWKNFLNHLKTMKLAKIEMNGRQIRNAITTARQLAKFKNQRMDYNHLKHVIKASEKFDKYLTSVREAVTDDQLAREEGFW